jgi:hypothetical protein
MSVVKAALALTMMVAFSVSCLADDRFRKDLLEEGYVPLDQTKNPGRWCFDDPQACSMYPELSSCAGDQQAPCRFEWETEDRRRFYIVTTGEDAHHLTVAGSEDESTRGLMSAGPDRSYYWYPPNSPRAPQHQPSMTYQQFIKLYHANGGK